MKLLRIGIITTDFSPTFGGIATLTESLSLHLSESALVEKVCVIAMNNKYNSVENINSKLIVKRFNTTSIFGLCLQTWKAMWSVRDYDVFHATTVFPIGLVAILFGKYILGKPVFVSYHGTDLLTNHGKIITKILKKWAFLHASKGIAISSSTKKLVEQKMQAPAGHSVVIGYAVSDTVDTVSESEKILVKDEFKIEDGDFVVLFVGNLVARKGCSDLFDAIALIDDKQIKLIFVGLGPERSVLENKQKALGLEQKIYFAGRRKSTLPFYAVADYGWLSHFAHD